MKSILGLLVLSCLLHPLALAQNAIAHAGNAVRLMQDRRYSEAATEFEAALAEDPQNDSVRIEYATCLFAQERNEEARRQFERESAKLGDRPGIRYYLGVLDLRAGHFEDAIVRLLPLETNTQFGKAPFYLALAYLGAGQTASGLRSMERAAKQNPRDPDVHYRLARLYTAAGRTGEAEREYSLYRTAREDQRLMEQLVPPCMDALKTQPIARAREVCGRISDSTDSGRLLLAGQLFAGAGAFADAVEPLRKAAALEPDSFEAWHYLGVSLYGLSRYKEAVFALRKAADLNPRYFDTLNLLAKALYSLGDYAGALPVVERAHDLNPGDRQLAAVLEGLRASQKGKE